VLIASYLVYVALAYFGYLDKLSTYINF